jgi:hypothetical protein
MCFVKVATTIIQNNIKYDYLQFISIIRIGHIPIILDLRSVTSKIRIFAVFIIFKVKEFFRYIYRYGYDLPPYTIS